MNPLIQPADLAPMLGNAHLRVFDCRWSLADPDAGRRAYEESHIPSAVFVDMERHLTGTEGPGRHPLPRPEQFSATLRDLGVDGGDHIVVYDASGGAAAARMWWMLRALGLGEVQVLDGGFPAWVDAGFGVTATVARVRPGSFATVREWTGVVDGATVSTWHGSLIDARAPERYRGEVEPLDPQAGHIPGAVNLPHTDNLDDTGRFLPPEVLANRFSAFDDPVVYCGSGVTACHDLLAMAVAGRHDGLLYAGSWSDWSRTPGRPIAVGDS